jgi:SRP54-type protein, GTPase domain
VSVVRDLGLPVKFIGVGEKIDDLRDFEAEQFVDALLGNNEETSLKMQARVNKMLNLEPMKALNNAMSDGPRKDSNEERLRASFGIAGESDEDEDDDEAGGSSSGKPKRAKRPKPQSAKPKKKPSKK